MHTESDHTSVRLTLQADRRCTSALYKPHMFPIHMRNTVNSKFPTQLTEETCSTHLLLAEFSVRTVNYGPSFFLAFRESKNKFAMLKKFIRSKLRAL